MNSRKFMYGMNNIKNDNNMGDIFHYAFKMAVKNCEIMIIKQCLDANIKITNEILISSVIEYSPYEPCYGENYYGTEGEYQEKTQLFNTIFNTTNKSKFNNDVSIRGKLIRKIFKLLLNNIPDNLQLSTDLIESCNSDDYLINEIVKTGRYHPNHEEVENFIYATLSQNNLDAAKTLLDNEGDEGDIYLESIILNSIIYEEISIFKSLEKLDINFNKFRTAIINNYDVRKLNYKNKNYIISEMKQILINGVIYPSKKDILIFMFLTKFIIIDHLDLSNFILSTYKELIETSNNEYISFLENTSPNI